MLHVHASSVIQLFVLIASDCTDLVSPSDHHVGAELKRLMSEFYRDSMQSKATRRPGAILIRVILHRLGPS